MRQLNKKVYVKPTAFVLLFDCCTAFAISMDKDSDPEDAFDDDEIGAPDYRSNIWEDD